jgi:hypothetical protein
VTRFFGAQDRIRLGKDQTLFPQFTPELIDTKLEPFQ